MKRFWKRKVDEKISEKLAKGTNLTDGNIFYVFTPG